jgi:hypothetical protein
LRLLHHFAQDSLRFLAPRHRGGQLEDVVHTIPDPVFKVPLGRSMQLGEEKESCVVLMECT